MESKPPDEGVRLPIPGSTGIRGMKKQLSKQFSKDWRAENLDGDGLAGAMVGRLQRRRAVRAKSSLLQLDDDDPPGAAPSPTGSFRRKASRSFTNSQGLGEEDPVPATPATPRRKARRSSTMAQGLGEEDPVPATPTTASRLRMLTSAVATLQSASKDSQDKKEEALNVDPNEVILDSESEDEEEEEVERDFLSALQRVQDSGRLSIHELRVFEKELKEAAPNLFEDKLDMVILAGLQNARYLEVKSDEVLWSRFSELYTGVLSESEILCFLIKGKMSIAKPGNPEGIKAFRGSVVNTSDDNVLGIVAIEACKLLYIDVAQVEADMKEAESARDKVEYNLRKNRPISTWPEALLENLRLTVQAAPFFENFDDGTLLSICRNLRFQCMPAGESLPPRVVEGNTKRESHLVIFWEGQAGKYKQVQSADQEMAKTQLEIMALESLGVKGSKGKAGITGGSPTSPELDDEAVDTVDTKVYLKRCGNLRPGAVLGESDLIEPGGPETGQGLVRCEGKCYVLSLARSDYLQCLKEQQVERMRVVHALRNVPASRPGEPHHRSQEQLGLLAKLVRNTPELKNFEQDALMQILGAATFINAAPGHVLCHQGEVGDRFFAVIEGMVSIHVRPKVEVESALATAAECKGAGNQLIKTMLAALSQHRVEANKKQNLAAPPPPAPQRSLSERSDDPSRAGSFFSDDGSPVVTPTSSMKQKRSKNARVSFFAESPESPPLSPNISVTAPATTMEEVTEVTPEESPTSSAGLDSWVVEGSESLSAKSNRRKSLKDRLRGGLFWSGIRKRLSSNNPKPPVQDLGKMVNRMGPGAAFGAKTLLKKDARTASVQTVQATKLLVVTREDYVGLMSSLEEARACEAAEFLCRHVLKVSARNGGNRALDNLHPGLRQRVGETSRHMAVRSLDRGVILLTHDTGSNDEVQILRKGSLGFCYPHDQQGCPARWHRSQVASMSVSQVVSTPGELVGVHQALLNCKEPATVRVESATCEVYRVSWTQLQQVLTNRVRTMIRENLKRCHALRSGVAAPQSAREMLKATARSSIVGAAPSEEQQAVKDALKNAFSTARAFDAPGSLRKGFKGVNSNQSKTNDDDFQEFVEALEKAIQKFQTTAEKAELWESLRTGEPNAVVTAPSLPPPNTSAAHVRARFYKVLKDDPGLLGVQKFLSEAVLDPEKSHLIAWMQKYVDSEKLQKHAGLQSLQMILYRLKNPGRRAPPTHNLRVKSN